jgi:hypothetical protein
MRRPPLPLLLIIGWTIARAFAGKKLAREGRAAALL